MAISPFSQQLARSLPQKKRKVRWILSGRTDSSAKVRELWVSTQPFTVGRNNGCGILINNRTVSGTHAELMLVDDDLFVRDNCSTNGTFLNGHRVNDIEGLRHGDLLQFGTAAYTVKKQVERSSTHTIEACPDEVRAIMQFERLITEPAVIPFFQPIVRLDNSRRVGYEMLVRSELQGLENPASMFRVAGDLELERELSVICRRVGLAAARDDGVRSQIYLNTHGIEMQTPELLQSLEELRAEFPAAPIMIEVHESAVTSSAYLNELRRKLFELDMQLAYDDFGAGQARLAELIDVPPDVIKFDMHLIRDIHISGREKQQMVASLVRMVRDLNIVPLAEGIESSQEADVCRDIGFQLAQGYFYGRPGPLSLLRGSGRRGR